MIDIGFWFMFPVGICIATIAMMSGIGGAIFFSPFFMLVLKLDPILAMGSGLAIEVFGFTSGVIGYVMKKSVNFKIVRQLVVLTVPSTMAGVALARFFPGMILKGLLAILLLYLAYQFLIKNHECVPKSTYCTGVFTDHENIRLSMPVRLSSIFGATLMGMISSGLGELNEHNFLNKLRMPVASASGTSVFLVAMSATVGSFFHAYFLVQHGETSIFTN
ncbi:hypothetical protein LCGC14_2725870, partial [marine sediment metagenome]